MKNFILKYHKQLIIVIILTIMFTSGIVVKAITKTKTPINSQNENYHNQIKVEIKGEVKYPNTYFLEEGSTISDVIILASGLTKYSDTSFINLNKEIKDEDVIFISKKIDTPTNRINLNTASINDLKKLTDIGETLAYNIIVFRTINGPFNSLYDLLKVNGMSIKIISKNINEICLS